MKRRITVRMSEQTVERLQAAAMLLGMRKSCVVERALDRFLGPEGDATKFRAVSTGLVTGLTRLNMN